MSFSLITNEILPRALNLVFGVGGGILTFMPNVMMSDSGTAVANAKASLGILASGTMLVGGVYGIITKSSYLTIAGYALQALVFIPFPE